MEDLLDKLTTYITAKTGLVAGENAFYNEMPDQPDKCLLIQEVPSTTGVPAQIDAEVHNIRVTVRDVSNTKAKQLADTCWNWLYLSNIDTVLQKYYIHNNDDGTVYLVPSSSADASVDLDDLNTTGFIELEPGIFVYVWLYGRPVWEKSDQKGRKYFTFNTQITTKR